MPSGFGAGDPSVAVVVVERQRIHVAAAFLLRPWPGHRRYRCRPALDHHHVRGAALRQYPLDGIRFGAVDGQAVLAPHLQSPGGEPAGVESRRPFERGPPCYDARRSLVG